MTRCWAWLLSVRALGGAVTKLWCARRSGLRRRKTIDRLRGQTIARNARTPSAGARAPSVSESFQLRWWVCPPLVVRGAGAHATPRVGGGGQAAHFEMGRGAGSTFAPPRTPPIAGACGVGLRPPVWTPRLRTVPAPPSTGRVACAPAGGPPPRWPPSFVGRWATGPRSDRRAP